MKKTLALVLALLLVLAVAGCAKGGGTTPTNAPATQAPADNGGSAKAALPQRGDFAAGPAWSVETEPNKTNGPWAQSYAVIDALAEQAKAYDGVAPKFTFSLACHDPAESAPGEFLTAWANAVTIATEGAVDFNIGWSGSMSGTMASLDDMKSGTIDFDWTLPCYFKGYMPLTNVIQNPGLGIKNGSAGSYAMWELYKSNPEIQAEFADDGELLFVWTNCTSPLSYKGSGEIDGIASITGNIRANSIINYLVTDWHGIKSFALSDPGVLNYYIDTNIGCSAYALMANADIWGALPADIQNAIKSVSGDYLLNLVDIWSFWEAAGRYGAVKNGGDIYAPSDAFAAQLAAAYDNVAAAWVAEQADPAVAQRIYDQAKELVAKYNAQFDW